MPRPNYKARAIEALKALNKASEIAHRDHEREEGIAAHDIRLMTTCVLAAIDALEGEAEP